MEVYFTEFHDNGVGIVFKIKKELYRAKSNFQEIAVFDTETFGKLLVLDGLVMLTERDEFVYHEMLVHPAFAFKKSVTKVGIIGGGDGGTVREVLRYDEVEEVYLVEIDRMVVEVSKKYLPSVSSFLYNERVKVFYEDGVRYLVERKENFDALFIDSSDPVGPALALYSFDFYKNIKKNLKKGGIVVFQSESPWYHGDVIKKQMEDLKKLFKSVYIYTASIPTYPGGLWSFTIASDRSLKKERDFVPSGLKYYNEDIQRHLFALPEFVKNVAG